MFIHASLYRIRKNSAIYFLNRKCIDNYSPLICASRIYLLEFIFNHNDYSANICLAAISRFTRRTKMLNQYRQRQNSLLKTGT